MESSKIFSKKREIEISIIISLLLLAGSLCLINYTNIDVLVQNQLFNFTDKTWLVDKDEPIKKFIFYKFPKLFFGLCLIVTLLRSITGFREKSQHRHRFFLIFLGLSLIPLIAGNIKKFTNVYCPNQLEIYGGSKPYVKIFESYPHDFYQEKKGKCFPAGHAVTGFALMILFFAFEKKSQRFLGLALGITLGWILGFYQMTKGVHFLGDTLITMLVCFILAALIAGFYLKFLIYDRSKNH